jgi:uncharacterized membrane protein
VGEASLVLHVLFASLVVGPQILLFFAVTPATWLVEDHDLRSRMLRVITSRFAFLFVVALLGLLVTGVYQLTNDSIVPPEIQDSMGEYRFGQILGLKIVLIAVLVVMVVFHAMVLARRTRDATEGVASGRLEAWELERARRNSLVFSGFMILVSIAILALGVLLAFAPFADQPA